MPDQTRHSTAEAASACGGLRVVTSAQGLPVELDIAGTQLRRPPEVLAAELLRLCRRAAMSAGVRLRNQLAAAGVSRSDLDLMALPTTDELAQAERNDDLAAQDWRRYAAGAVR